MKFDIQPYIGAAPITFGMSRDEAHRILGLPESSHPIWDGSGISESYNRSGFNIGFDTSDAVNHLGFGPGGAELTIQGTPIWTPQLQPDPNPLLLRLDPNPLEVVGFWVFLQIGITTTGYHDGDDGQRAITVFAQELKQDWLEGAASADTSKYR